MAQNFRRCISCRKVAHKQEFWRVVKDHASQAVTLDVGMGRSAYLCPQTNCLQLAQRKHRLDRALKAPVPEAIYQALWQRLAPAPADSRSKTATHPHPPPLV